MEIFFLFFLTFYKGTYSNAKFSVILSSVVMIPVGAFYSGFTIIIIIHFELDGMFRIEMQQVLVCVCINIFHIDRASDTVPQQGVHNGIGETGPALAMVEFLATCHGYANSGDYGSENDALFHDECILLIMLKRISYT